MTMWIRTDKQEPPQDLLLDTISEGGQQTQLVRSGNLFFYPDKSMYVYYCPEFWRLA